MDNLLKTHSKLEPRPKKYNPSEKRVVRFEHHDAHKHQHQHWRDQNGIHQGQPLPGHMHKDRDNQACLQNHEQENERPSEVSMDTEEVEEKRTKAQDKKPSPDHEIKLNRVLLPFDVCDCCLCHGPSPKIEKGKDEHPHQVNEVPVQAHDFDVLVVSLPAGEKASRFAVEVSTQHLSRNDDQEDHSNRHMGAVEAGDHEKTGAKLVRAPRVA